MRFFTYCRSVYAMEWSASEASGKSQRARVVAVSIDPDERLKRKTGLSEDEKNRFFRVETDRGKDLLLLAQSEVERDAWVVYIRQSLSGERKKQ